MSAEPNHWLFGALDRLAALRVELDCLSSGQCDQAMEDAMENPATMSDEDLIAAWEGSEDEVPTILAEIERRGLDI